MADTDVTASPSGAMEDCVLDLMMFVQVCESLDTDSNHAWLYVVGGLARALHEAVQACLVPLDGVTSASTPDALAAGRSELEDRALALMSFVRVCQSLDDDANHAWVYALGRLAYALDRAVQAYLVPPNGGMGAMAPMVTQKLERPSILTRQ